MIYIGYPVELAEACRLLKLHFDREIDDYEYRKDYMKRIDQYFHRHGIRFIQQDKGLCIIGINFNEWAGSIWEKNSTCDETMILILKAKGKVEDAMKEADIDISTIYIAQRPKALAPADTSEAGASFHTLGVWKDDKVRMHMEGEEVEMHHPQPLFIHCPFDY